MSSSDFPREIEVGGGPNVIVGSQEEHDSFIRAARTNALIVKEREVEDGRSVRVVAVFNMTLERPDAPLVFCGPFASREEQLAFRDRWAGRLAAPYMRVSATYLPTIAEFEAHLESGAFDLVEGAEGAS